jgi:hypothetical protein
MRLRNELHRYILDDLKLRAHLLCDMLGQHSERDFGRSEEKARRLVCTSSQRVLMLRSGGKLEPCSGFSADETRHLLCFELSTETGILGWPSMMHHRFNWRLEPLELINVMFVRTEHQIGTISACLERATAEDVEGGISGNASQPSTFVCSELPTFVLNQCETAEYQT